MTRTGALYPNSITIEQLSELKHGTQPKGSVCDGDPEFQVIAADLGFAPVDNPEYEITLPDGYSIVTMSKENDLYKRRCHQSLRGLGPTVLQESRFHPLLNLQVAENMVDKMEGPPVSKSRRL